MTRHMSAKEARDNFSDLIGSVYYSDEPVVVEKKGRPFAVVISPREYERYQAWAKEQFFGLVDTIQARAPDVDEEALLAEITAEVEAVRQERYEQRATARRR